MLHLIFIQLFVYSHSLVHLNHLFKCQSGCVMALKDNKKLSPLYHSIILLIYGDIKIFHGFINIALEIPLLMFLYFISNNEIFILKFLEKLFSFIRPLSKAFCISVSFIQSRMLKFSGQRNFFYLSWKLIERWTERVPPPANSKQRAELVKISMNDISKIKIKVKNMYFWVFCNRDFVAAVVTNDFIVSGNYIRQTLISLGDFFLATTFLLKTRWILWAYLFYYED